MSLAVYPNDVSYFNNLNRSFEGLPVPRSMSTQNELGSRLQPLVTYLKNIKIIDDWALPIVSEINPTPLKTIVEPIVLSGDDLELKAEAVPYRRIIEAANNKKFETFPREAVLNLCYKERESFPKRPDFELIFAIEPIRHKGNSHLLILRKKGGHVALVTQTVTRERKWRRECFWVFAKCK